MKTSAESGRHNLYLPFTKEEWDKINRKLGSENETVSHFVYLTLRRKVLDA